VERIKFVEKKNINEYIDAENQLIEWGGTDSYSYSFEPEVRVSKTQKSSRKKISINNNVSASSGSEESTPDGKLRKVKKITYYQYWALAFPRQPHPPSQFSGLFQYLSTIQHFARLPSFHFFHKTQNYQKWKRNGREKKDWELRIILNFPSFWNSLIREENHVNPYWNFGTP